MKSSEILNQAANILIHSDITTGACAKFNKIPCEVNNPLANCFCISGAIRLVTGFYNDFQIDYTKENYYKAANLFCQRAKTIQIMDWMDNGKRTLKECIDILKLV